MTTLAKVKAQLIADNAERAKDRSFGFTLAQHINCMIDAAETIHAAFEASKVGLSAKHHEAWKKGCA